MKVGPQIANAEVVNEVRQASIAQGKPFNDDDAGRIGGSGRGPYFSLLVSGPELGQLHYQRAGQQGQDLIGTFFDEWLEVMPPEDRLKHQSLVEVLKSGHKFTYRPVFDRRRWTVDGAHRTLAAYDVFLRHDPHVEIEILAERFW
jgi:hypothetical protein